MSRRISTFLIILLSTTIIITIIILLIVNKHGEKIQESQDNTVVSYQINSNQAKFPDELYKKYSDILPLSYSLENNSNISNLYSFSFKGSNNSVIRFILVDASLSKNSVEVYERVNTSKTLTGKFNDSSSIEIDGLKVNLAIKIESLGAGQYFLIGGYKNNNRGYYFEIPLDDFRFHSNLTEEEKKSIFALNYKTISPNFINLIKDIISESISIDYFHKLDFNYSQQEINNFKKDNDNLYPSTF